MRLFLGLSLPVEIQLALESWSSDLLRDRDRVRIIPAGDLHVTAVFIGERAAAEVSSIESMAARIASQARPPRLTADTVDAIPRRRPRVLALGLRDEGGHAAALHSELTAALAQIGLEVAEGRPYWPHVTVARLRDERPLSPAPEKLPRLEPFEPPALSLYRSELGPQGSRYTQLASARFSREA